MAGEEDTGPPVTNSQRTVPGFLVSVLGLAEGFFPSLAGSGFAGGLGLDCGFFFPHPNTMLRQTRMIVALIIV